LTAVAIRKQSQPPRTSILTVVAAKKEKSTTKNKYLDGGCSDKKDKAYKGSQVTNQER
jgi:hypothetical protein